MTQPTIIYPLDRVATPLWRWPLPRIGAHDPRIIGAHASEARRGVDIGYAGASVAERTLVPVYAAQAGEVAGAMETDFGYSVTLDHCNRTWSTIYGHLAQMNLAPRVPRLQAGEPIEAGTILGYAARAPHHIRFELWQWTHMRGFVAVDPTPYLAHWRITTSEPKPIDFAPPKEG